MGIILFIFVIKKVSTRWFIRVWTALFFGNSKTISVLVRVLALRITHLDYPWSLPLWGTRNRKHPWLVQLYVLAFDDIAPGYYLTALSLTYYLLSTRASFLGRIFRT